MTQHAELIEQLRGMRGGTWSAFEVANVIESQSREIAELKEQLRISAQAVKWESDLAEQAMKDMEGLRKDAMRWQNQYNELRHLVDRRPAINAGLIPSYMRWNTECYLLDFHNADDAAADEAMNQQGGSHGISKSP